MLRSSSLGVYWNPPSLFGNRLREVAEACCDGWQRRPDGRASEGHSGGTQSQLHHHCHPLRRHARLRWSRVVPRGLAVELSTALLDRRLSTQSCTHSIPTWHPASNKRRKQRKRPRRPPSASLRLTCRAQCLALPPSSKSWRRRAGEACVLSVVPPMHSRSYGSLTPAASFVSVGVSFASALQCRYVTM